MFEHDAEVPPDFLRSLEEAVPPYGEHLSWLVPAWVPGTPDDPIQRWALYEATPAPHVPDFKRELLDLTELDDAFPERRRIAEYWQQHRALLEPFWIVQGERGGHKYRFNARESKELRLLELPDEPPEPGALPGAPLDARVLRAVLTWDALRRGYGRLAELRAEEREAGEREFRARLLAWLGEQSAASAAELATLPADTFARTETDRVPDLAEAEDRYVETGSYHL